MSSAQSNTWHILHSGASGAAENMALDQALLENAPELGSPILRLYGWIERAASFGYFQKYAAVEKMTLFRPLVRRPTGGGLVPHDADWTYSLAFPPVNEWYALKAVESYERVHEWLRRAFQKLGVETELAASCRVCGPGQCFEGWEKFDVLWQGRKIAGAAQRRTRDGLLIQGSVQPPPVKIARADWERAMCEVATTGWDIIWKELQPEAGLQRRVNELSSHTYSQPAYNQRR
jgi:lipoate-protein ligase A